MEPVAIEMTELKLDSMEKTEAVIVEGRQQDPEWRRVIDLVIERKGGPNRLLIMAVSFADDEMQVFASQRIGSSDPAHLLGILEAWSREADR